MRSPSQFIVFIGFLAVAACGSEDNGGDATLPPSDTMVLADPSDVDSSAQALCASDTRAYDALHAFIAANNAQIQNAIDLVQAAVKAEKVKLKTSGQVSYTASGAQRSLVIVATEADDNSLAYEATFTGPNVGSYTLLSGSANADRTSGAWTIYAADGTTAVTVTWTKSGDDLHVVRKITGTDRVATYDRVSGDVSVVFTGTDYAASATWDTATGDGSVTVNGEAKACFTKTASDFCSEAC